MPDIAKACLTCAHFYIVPEIRGYSELTPGSPAEINCERSGEAGCAWPVFDCDNDATMAALALRTIAEKCALYEVHPNLKVR